MTIKPHPAFEILRADEVSECWEGVSEALYFKLWNEIVPLQKPIPNREDSGPADHVGHANLAAHWHLLSEDEQQALNALAVARDLDHRQRLTETMAAMGITVVNMEDPAAMNEAIRRAVEGDE